MDIHVRQMARNGIESKFALPQETLGMRLSFGKDSDINVQGTEILLDSESQAAEIAPTEGIRKSGCGPFVLCR